MFIWGTDAHYISGQFIMDLSAFLYDTPYGLSLR